MYKNQFDLLKQKRFLPLFITQFLGAFNDNLFKNALVILITYVVSHQSGVNPQFMVTLAAAIFILPFFLFSATAGQLADKYEKSQQIRIIKIIELLLMLGAALGFYLENSILLMVVLFLMGSQSAFFGPLKYSILPEHLKTDELVAGNAFIETGTFLSILLGTIIGGILILGQGGIFLVSSIIIVVAISGVFASWFIPKTIPTDKELRINKNFLTETWNIMRYATKHREVFLSILGISWFWLVGATFLAQFPSFVKFTLSADEQVVTLFLTLFSIGIGIGSLVCNRLLKGEVSAYYVPFAAIGITLFTVDLYFASQHITATDTILIGVGEFLANVKHWRIIIDLLAIAICAGIYIVPLYAIMQNRSDAGHRARVIASNNILNALFMVMSAVVTLGMLAFGFSVPEVFLTVALANGVVALYICKLLPRTVIRAIGRSLFTWLYKVEIKGLENYHAAGDRVLIIANHTSMLDAALLALFLPDRLTFAINTQQAQRWFIKPLLSLVRALPLDPGNPMATKTLIEEAKNNNKIVIFPEGRITVTGALMKIYEGPGLVADKSGAQVLPIRIDGAQYTPFSRLKGIVRLKWFPNITLTILKPCDFTVDKMLKGRKRRTANSEKLYDIMTNMMFQSSNYNQTLLQSLLDARFIHGGKHLIAEDVNRKAINYNQLLTKSYVLGKALEPFAEKGEIVGVLLPNMISNLASFFAIQVAGQIPAMLNFSTGINSLISCCNTANIKTIYSAKQFIEAAGFEEMVSALEAQGITIHYLEDIASSIGLAAKLKGLFFSRYALYRYDHTDPNNTAVILFTSGSEGKPKAVLLSHCNINANVKQLASRVDFGPRDKVFNALPMFHSFGLTGGTLLPVLSGIKVFFYPSPLHYRIVPELVYDTNATILFGTDTFLSGYARYAHAYDFYSIRYVFAGAEKLKEETRKIWSEKFGVRIFEGYGATETAPALSTNTPMHNKPGTVGRLMPGIESRVEPMPGIEEGGKLLVKGPNIMKGYYLSDNPATLVPPEGGWYDTGDIVTIDDQGYITIAGRVKRFAKIAGEMVSLTAVETYLSELWPGFHHAVIATEDAKKGEKLILVTDYENANKGAIIAYVKQHGLADISIPKIIHQVDTVPLLGTGKTDYVKVRELVA